MIKPIYGQGIFVVCRDGSITQQVIFDYVDSEGYYWSLMGDEKALNEELSRLMYNMQSFIDDETVKINGERVFPKVIGIDVGFRSSGSNPYITFYIAFKGNLRKGINIYEDYYEPEDVEYDYVVTWIFSGGLKVIRANVGFNYDITSGGSILMFSVPKGARTPGYERIEFLF